MRLRFFQIICVVVWLLPAALSHALPPAADLAKKERRESRPRPKPTPTSLPYIEPVIVPEAAPVPVAARPTSAATARATAGRTAPTTTRSSAPVAAPVVTRVPAPTATTTSSASSRTRQTTVPPEQRPSTVVVIDAGHGGFDRGGIPRQQVPEKTMNLDVALRLRALLQASGYRVVMTRDTDVFVPLGTRVAIANQYRDAIFVCIHFNSATRRGASGIETYFYSQESLRLASAIHYYVSGFAPSSNRGVRRRGFFVLRRTRIPSVLVECGFLTNPTEAQYAQSAAYRQRLAEEIARGVRNRGSVSSSRVASAEVVPLQPFIDQTRIRDPDTSRRRSKKSSKSKSSKSTSSSKKKSTKKTSSDSDDEGTSKKKSSKKSSSDSDDSGSTKKKKSSPKKSED
jgi:N-acetylmuramoyl-L-alanine amidase